MRLIHPWIYHLYYLIDYPMRKEVKRNDPIHPWIYHTSRRKTNKKKRLSLAAPYRSRTKRKSISMSVT